MNNVSLLPSERQLRDHVFKLVVVVVFFSLVIAIFQANALAETIAGQTGVNAGFFVGNKEKKDVADSSLPADNYKSSVAYDLLFQTTGYLSYSSLAGGGHMIGGKGSVVFAPVVKFDEEKSLILLYTGSYRKTKQVFVQDEGPKLFSEDIVQNVIPTFRYMYSSKMAISPSVVFTEVKTKETSEDTWSNGLYNYRDVGGGIKVEYQLEADSDEKQDVSFGVQCFRRKYSNFISLASIAGIGSFEEREKDFDGTLVSINHLKLRKFGWSNTAKLSFLDKRYVDKLIENETGERDPVKQHDINLHLHNDLLYKLESGWGYGLGLSLGYTESNQNMTEGTFPAVVFHPNYYSLYSISLRPSVSFVDHLSCGKIITYSAQYGVTRSNYVERHAKDSNGVLLDDKQVDWASNLTLRMVYTLDKHWNIGMVMDYSKVSSNMHYEQVYRYNYEVMNLSAGFSFRY